MQGWTLVPQPRTAQLENLIFQLYFCESSWKGPVGDVGPWKEHRTVKLEILIIFILISEFHLETATDNRWTDFRPSARFGKLHKLFCGPLFLAKILNDAERGPSLGYQSMFAQQGFGTFAAKGLADLLVNHGERRAREEALRRGVFEAIRFLAQPGRRPSAVLKRAKQLLDASSIVQTAFIDAGISETEFLGLLRSAVAGQEFNSRRIQEIAASLAPTLAISRGPKVSAASAAHQFLLSEVAALWKGREAYTWSDAAEDFTDAATKATRLEFGQTDFDPRPACRRVKRSKATRGWPTPPSDPFLLDFRSISAFDSSS